MSNLLLRRRKMAKGGSIELLGPFTVNSSGKRVMFAKGLLYWDGTEFKLEENQYDFPTSWNPNHVGHFNWGATVADAIDDRAWYYPAGSTFFAADGGAIEGFTVLTNSEWDYLIPRAVAENSLNEPLIVIDGKNCIVLKPDGFSGTVKDSYTAAEWATAEASGLVALPLTGWRSGKIIKYMGEYGHNWSLPLIDDDLAWSLYYDTESVVTDGSFRNDGHAVALVKVL